MKLIEAMKKVKANKDQIADLQARMAKVSANLSNETPLYGAETGKKIAEWLQGCTDLSRDNVGLLVAIAKTNLATQVTITLGEKPVTKCIAEWVWRRREYAELDRETWTKLTDRGLKEAVTPTSTGVNLEIKIQRHYDPAQKDNMLALYRSEPHAIDAALEVINATTDLVQ